jgi:hypothetical protein
MDDDEEEEQRTKLIGFDDDLFKENGISISVLFYQGMIK